jgi:hypothetical protein
MSETVETAETGAQIKESHKRKLPRVNSTGGPHNGPQGSREAKYRVERNEARAERDSLTERLTELQTRELHRLAGELLAAPEDIELSGKVLADYLTPEGWLDREAVAEAAAAVIESRPGLAKNLKVAATDLSQGRGTTLTKRQPTMLDLLKS